MGWMLPFFHGFHPWLPIVHPYGVSNSKLQTSNSVPPRASIIQASAWIIIVNSKKAYALTLSNFGYVFGIFYPIRRIFPIESYNDAIRNI